MIASSLWLTCLRASRTDHGEQLRRFSSPLRSRSGVWPLMVAAVLMPVAVQAEVSNGDFELRYTPALGNLSLVFTGVGASGTGPVSLKSLAILTLGDGEIGSAMPSGIPNVTAGQGGLNGLAAILPPAAVQTFNTQVGLNGLYSEIFNAGLTSWRTFDKTSPGVSDVLDLGNVAAVGWGQQIVDTIFITDSDTYTSLNPGYFGYITDSTPLVGRVVAVPEPTLPVVAIGFTALIVAGRCRRARASRACDGCEAARISYMPTVVVAANSPSRASPPAAMTSRGPR